MLQETNDADDDMLIKDYSHYRVKLRCIFKFTIVNYVTQRKIFSCSNFLVFYLLLCVYVQSSLVLNYYTEYSFSLSPYHQHGVPRVQVLIFEPETGHSTKAR